MTTELILLTLILLSGLYMSWNIGANDVANAIGTSVGSGALSLRQAVILAGILELCGAFFFGGHVSRTIEEGVVNTSLFTHDPLLVVYGMLACLVGAGIWLQTASYFGWPVSTTHSIVGAVVGFGLAAGGLEAIYWENVTFIAFSWILSPLIGGLLAFFIFSFVLKKIFYVKKPLLAAKKYLPLLVFAFITTITFILSYDGLKFISISFTSAVCISIIAGIVAAFISYRSIPDPKAIPLPDDSLAHFSPDLIDDLTEARRSLSRAKALATGEARYQVSRFIHGVDNLSHSLKETSIHTTSQSDHQTVEKLFGKLQIISASLMAFSHGANDVANAIGPLAAAVTVLLTGSIVINETVPLWALLLGGIGIVIGLATWGWRVIETIGRKLTELTPSRGFSAEFGAAVTILIASRLGFPISATHTLVGAVLGVGFARGIEALNLKTMRDIVISWLVTIPIGAVLATTLFYLFRWLFH